MPSRLRLSQQLALLLAATICLALVGMAAVMAWGLRSGFVDYLNASDEERLGRFAQVVQVSLTQHPLQQWEASPRTLGAWLSALDRWERSDEPEPEPASLSATGPGLAGAPPPEPRRPPGGGRPHPRPPPPAALSPRLHAPPESAGFASRVSVWDLQGRRLWGAALHGSQQPIEQEVLLQGQPVLRLRLERIQRVPAGVGSAFIQRQTLLIASVGLLALLVSMAVGTLWAKRWVARLAAAREAAAAIARGELSLRLPEQGGDELADLARSMNAMAVALQSLEGSRRQWMAEISHELRTPLAVLHGEIEALQDGVRPFTPQALQSLHAEVRQLSRLVDDLHLLALSDLKALPCDLRPTLLTPWLETWVARMQARASERGLQLQLLPAPAQAWVSIDAGRMEQLLMNLLENSLRYTDAPGRVEVSLTRDGGQWLLAVEDSPPGVPADMCGRLFEPLFRLDAARSRHAQSGGGLGLSVAQAIAKAHGGNLQAAPSRWGGLRVSLRLPAQAAPVGAA